MLVPSNTNRRPSLLLAMLPEFALWFGQCFEVSILQSSLQTNSIGMNPNGFTAIQGDTAMNKSPKQRVKKDSGGVVWSPALVNKKFYLAVSIVSVVSEELCSWWRRDKSGLLDKITSLATPAQKNVKLADKITWSTTWTQNLQKQRNSLKKEKRLTGLRYCWSSQEKKFQAQPCLLMGRRHFERKKEMKKWMKLRAFENSKL